MTGAQPQESTARARGWHRALRGLHLGALGVLAGSAVAIVSLPTDGPADAIPPRPFTLTAIALAVGVVATRRLSTSPRMGPTGRAGLAAASLVQAAALGPLSLALAHGSGATQSALVFTLAAAVFALRPPAPGPDTAPPDR